MDVVGFAQARVFRATGDVRPDLACLDKENPDYLSKQLITYIGNKRQLLPMIEAGITEVARAIGKDRLVTLDLFSGSGVVSRLLKAHSGHIYVNDLELYSKIVNECYLSDADPTLVARLRALLHDLRRDIQANWVHDGFIAEIYAPADDNDIHAGERVFYSRRNAEFLDTARQSIGRLPDDMRKFFLAPLLSQASVHTNTSGVFKGFYKNDDGVGCFGGSGKNSLKRILGNIDVELPVFSRFSCRSTVLQGDALTVTQSLPTVDLAYLDPPYNQHPYGSNYFMLNLLATYKRPEDLSEVSGIPRTWNRSPYNQPGVARTELFKVIAACKARFLLISYSSEGFIPYEDFVEYLGSLGDLKTMEATYNTFRGSRNLHKRDIHVKEYLFLLEKDV
ncbi:MAG TPA: DNA modification methylase [Coriobacteriia bacterium]|nr:DNA modification methylase [Coriobacteriia bacterium]